MLVVVVAAAWAALNGLWFAADASRRYRAEAAWFVFAAVLLVIAVWAITDRRQQVHSRRPSDLRQSLPVLIALLILSFALYYPMLSIGLLSDDFVLLARARSGVLFDPAWEFVRPLPIALWRIANAPFALHALNITLHAINAWLTAILAVRFGLPRVPAILAGVIFLALPSAVEPVAWAAGVFDVLMVTLMLAACVAITTIERVSWRTISVVTLTAAALATKETAVVAPALLIVSSFCASRTPRDAAMPVAGAIGVVAAYFVLRVTAGFAATPPAGEISGYVLKELLSRPFATLALPFHAELLQAYRWIPFVFALFWPLLFAASSMQWRSDRGSAMRVLGCALWILCSVAPLATMLFIAGDLQGSRYVYLGSAAFAIMTVALTTNFDRTVQMLAMLPLVALFAMAARSHQSAWAAAAAERDRVLDAYRDGNSNCDPVEVRGLPDHVRGAYVFRNGFRDAVHADVSAPKCAVAWDGTRFAIDR